MREYSMAEIMILVAIITKDQKPSVSKDLIGDEFLMPADVREEIDGIREFEKAGWLPRGSAAQAYAEWKQSQEADLDE
jgi:hypothetical protein